MWQRRRNGCAHVVSEYYTHDVDGTLSVNALPLDLMTSQHRAAQLIRGELAYHTRMPPIHAHVYNIPVPAF